MSARPTIVSVEVETSTGHRLMEYHGKCANLHGHNYRWVVEVASELTKENRPYGMACDFGVLKNLVRTITGIFDHAMVLRHDDPMIGYIQLDSSRLVILNVNPTAENLAQYVADEVLAAFPGSVFVNVVLWETSKCSANARGVPGSPAVEITSFVSGRVTA